MMFPNRKEEEAIKKAELEEYYRVYNSFFIPYNLYRNPEEIVSPTIKPCGINIKVKKKKKKK